MFVVLEMLVLLRIEIIEGARVMVEVWVLVVRRPCSMVHARSSAPRGTASCISSMVELQTFQASSQHSYECNTVHPYVAAHRNIASSKVPTSELQWPTKDKLCTIGPSLKNISAPDDSDPVVMVDVAEMLLDWLVELFVVLVLEMVVNVALLALGRPRSKVHARRSAPCGTTSCISSILELQAFQAQSQQS